MPRHATYDVESVTIGTVTIRDTTNGKPLPSVTNDAEHVVAELLASGSLKPGMRLMYYDTRGDLDEIVFDALGFKRFRPGPVRVSKSIYPPGWPNCLGCGEPALDGHITCGKAECNESARRNGEIE